MLMGLNLSCIGFLSPSFCLCFACVFKRVFSSANLSHKITVLSCLLILKHFITSKYYMCVPYWHPINVFMLAIYCAGHANFLNRILGVGGRFFSCLHLESCIVHLSAPLVCLAWFPSWLEGTHDDIACRKPHRGPHLQCVCKVLQ